MAGRKILYGEGFWDQREPIWDETIRALYPLADIVSTGEPGDYASRLLFAGSLDGVLANSGTGLNWFQLSQRAGLEVKPGSPKNIKMDSPAFLETMRKMMYSKGRKEVDQAVCIAEMRKGEYYLFLEHGTLQMDFLRRPLLELKGALTGGSGVNTIAYISLVVPGAAGYKVSKDGGVLTECIGGWINLEYYPKRGKEGVVTAWTRIERMGPSADGPRMKNMQFLEVDIHDEMVTKYDDQGNPRKRRKLNKDEAVLFLPG